MVPFAMTGDPLWHIESPGRLVLPGTLYAITWDGLSWYHVEWNGHSIGTGTNIEDAKRHAAWHAGQLMEIELDPTDPEPSQ